MDRVHGGGPWTRGPCFVLSQYLVHFWLTSVYNKLLSVQIMATPFVKDLVPHLKEVLQQDHVEIKS